MTNRVGVLALCLIFALGGSVQASDIVSRFQGDWIGEGVVRPHGFDAQVVVRCRIMGDKMSATQISFAGKCVTANGSGAFNLMIAQDASGRAFAARGRFSQTREWVEFKGEGDEAALMLKQTKPLSHGVELWTSEITLGFRRNGSISFDNTLLDITTGRRALSFSVIFRLRD